MKSFSREMDNVSRLFMSSSDAENDTESSQSHIKELPLNGREGDVEIEEKVTVEKKFAFPKDPDVQNQIMIRLQTLLRHGYNICRIELKKNTNIKSPGRKETIDEQVILFVKESEAE